jgi:predicted esterase
MTQTAINRRGFLLGGLSALAAPMLLGCGDPFAAYRRGPRLTARPGSPTVTPTLGLTEIDLLGRPDGLLYVPESYAPDTPTPLFVALHGGGRSCDFWESYTTRAEQWGMVLLAPDSRSYTWDAVLGHFGRDVEFLDLALRHTFDCCRIDPTRLALGGFSDGASYALSLGLPNGDLFSHVVAYSPGFYVHPDEPVGKPPVYISHGTQDTIFPVTATRNTIVSALRKDGYDVTYEEFEGPHTIPAEISGSALDWFLNAG